MAFGCVMWLKSECDGCGACQEERVSFFNRRRPPVFCDDDFDPDPFEPDWEEEEY